MAKDIAAELMAMKGKIDQAENKAAQLHGRLDGIFERLHSEYSLDSLEAADKLLTALDKELNDKEAALAVGVEELNLEFQKLEV